MLTLFMPSSLSIPRVRLPELPKGVEELAAKAASLLGYTALSGGSTQARVLRVMKRVGVLPLKHEAVVSYQQKWQRKLTNSRYDARWNCVQMRAYSQPIPVSIIESAVKLVEGLKAENLPHEVYVDSLVRNRIEYDPFLSLYDHGWDKKIFFAVWDEPTFRG